jgi:primosomal protein N' (replication factor Y)
MKRFVNVALKVAHNNGIFSYLLPSSAPATVFGKRVRVSFRNRMLTGIIIGECPEPMGFTVKEIDEIIDEKPMLSPPIWDLISFCSRYYFNELGTTVQLALPRNDKSPKTLSRRLGYEKAQKLELNPEQKSAYEAILAAKECAVLLQGVTGSGKTHVYLSVALKTLQEGKSLLFLLPEISLTTQLIERVEKGLNVKAHVLHSNVSAAKKRDVLFSLLEEKQSVVIGARSAIFAPINNLGLIVVDEEHDGSLKQDDSPRYHARDLALWRAKNEGARIILGSATPSLESIANVHKNKLVHLFLHKRFVSDRALPQVEIVDLKARESDVDSRRRDQSLSAGQRLSILSRPLVLAMQETMAQNLQVLLFLNQRGYARFGVCYDCGHMIECPHCSVGLTYYQKREQLLCHQCSFSMRALKNCLKCGSDNLHYLGLGTERLEEEIRTHFPDIRMLRIDRDIVRKHDLLEDSLRQVHNNHTQVLLGTQMITKGHDFLHVGLVGVICADQGLAIADFRAAEKSFQLLTQVAGRAGRGAFAGRAIVQCFDPKAPSIQFAQNHDVEGFIAHEMRQRQIFGFPPFQRSALIRFEHSNKDLCEMSINKCALLIKNLPELTVMGPVPSPIERIKNRYRYQFLLLAKSAKVLSQALMTLKSNVDLQKTINKSHARFIIDVDPVNMN